MTNTIIFLIIIIAALILIVVYILLKAKTEISLLERKVERLKLENGRLISDNQQKDMIVAEYISKQEN